MPVCPSTNLSTAWTQRFAATALLLLAASGCSHKPVVEAPVAEVEEEKTAALPALEGSSPGPVVAKNERRLGDVQLMRFSGSFRDQELLLREEVVDMTDSTFTVDYTLDDGFDSSTLRVVHARRSERIVSVARVSGEKELPATAADFEKLLEKTTFVPSQNRGAISERSETCLVGATEYECDYTAYRVLVDDQEATLKVARTDTIDRDVSGEIMGVDGTIIYRAQIVERTQGEPVPQSESSVALKDAR